MDSDKLNRWLTLIANIAVVAGIVFLRIEVNQNNTLMNAQAKATVSTNRLDHSVRLTDPETAALIVKARNNDLATEEERLRYRALLRSMILSWESEFELLKDGLIDYEDVPVNGWKGSFNSWTGLPEFWDEQRRNSRPDFIQFIEDNVANQP